MVKKQYLKSSTRFFLKHIVQAINMAAIFFVSIGIMSGLGILKYNINSQINYSYKTNNVHDLRIIGDPDNLENIYAHLEYYKKEFEIKNMEYSFSYDLPDPDGISSKRVAIMDFTNYENNKDAIDKLSLISGRFPKKGECVVIEPTSEIKAHKLGEQIEIDEFGNKSQIVGIVHNPTVILKDGEPSVLLREDGKSFRVLNDGVYYCDTPKLKTAIMVTLNDEIRNKFPTMSTEYLNRVNIIRDNILKFSIGVSSCFTLTECRSFLSLSTASNKVATLSLIMSILFSLITLLVVYSSMSRLIDEDRKSIAVLKTLGYSNKSIVMRYIVFIFISGAIGCLLSAFPSHLVSKLGIQSFLIGYNVSSTIAPPFNGVFFFLSLVLLLVSLIITFVVSYKSSLSSPVSLLTPKAPKPGKKVFIENIKKLWNKLSFKYKSTTRNIFLFKSRFLLTFFSIASSTALIFISLALFDNSLKVNMSGLAAIKYVSLALLVFSALLCALVIYNIANINISERTREIATLMVLGYRSKEVEGYIYREIYIMSIMSSLIGLPIGIGFSVFLFKFFSFGNLSNVNWWSYILTPIITFIFAYLASLLLKNKINKIDMNDSLKILE